MSYFVLKQSLQQAKYLEEGDVVPDFGAGNGLWRVEYVNGLTVQDKVDVVVVQVGKGGRKSLTFDPEQHVTVVEDFQWLPDEPYYELKGLRK